MKRPLWFRKLICWVIGHNTDQCDDYATECFRCGLLFDFDRRPRSDLGFWLTYYYWTGLHGRWLWQLREWWKCPWCGRRFGKHDQDKCCPF